MVMGIPTQEWEKDAWLNLTSRFPIAISSDKVFTSFGNKIEFKKFMNENNFGQFVPQVYKSIEEAKYPSVVKLQPITGSDSRGVHIVFNRTHLDDVIKKYTVWGEPFLLEEAVISNSEICFSISAYQGNLLGADDCLHFNPKDGSTLKILDSKYRYSRDKVECNTLPNWPIMHKLTVDIVKAASYNGFACIQYKYTANKDIKVLEINPRLCAGLAVNAPVLANFVWSWWNASAVSSNKYPMIE